MLDKLNFIFVYKTGPDFEDFLLYNQHYGNVDYLINSYIGLLWLTQTTLPPICE